MYSKSIEAKNKSLKRIATATAIIKEIEIIARNTRKHQPPCQKQQINLLTVRSVPNQGKIICREAKAAKQMANAIFLG